MTILDAPYPKRKIPINKPGSFLALVNIINIKITIYYRMVVLKNK